MFTAVDQLPGTARKLLERSWAQTFYDEYFSRIDEKLLSVIYSKKKSRPNTPVNILMNPLQKLTFYNKSTLLSALEGT